MIIIPIKINPFISHLTGITDSDVRTSPTFSMIQENITDLLSGRIFMAHNVRFDYSFIMSEYLRLNQIFHFPHVCSVKLSRRLYPQYRHHNLDAIIDRFNMGIENRHRALPDAKAIFSFLQASCAEKGIDTISDEITKQIKHPTLPTKLTVEDIYKLPTSTGVYIFYGAGGVPLYVGKGLNLKERVLSHFYGDIDSAKGKQINQSIEYIETKICAGELEALLTEAKLIKELSPLYNRRLLSAIPRLCILKWPYAGPIVIHERDDRLELDTFHIVDKWTVIKSVHSPDDIAFTTNAPSEISLDEYKILKRYLSKQQNSVNISSRMRLW